jgi:Ca2+-dependent lipid-binding protein
VTNVCGLDSTYQWNLTVVSATISGVHDTGSPGSCGSTIVDGYVTVDLAGNVGTSDVEEETTTPVWNDLLITDSAGVFTGNELSITVWDDDDAGQCSPNDLIESCVHQVTEDELLAGGFTIALCGADVADLVFDLDPT